MADKSFGVKQVNLIGASGTPTIESPNNLNLNAVTVAISTDATIGNELNVSGISTIGPSGIDVNGSIKSSSLNISGISTVGVVTGATYYGDASNTVDARWTLGALGDFSAYTFNGVGFAQTANDPVLYLVRGGIYEFVNNSGGSHPFEIRVSEGGSAYNTGVTNNSSASGVIKFEVPINAPSTLYYQCTSHSSMGNVISILDGSNISNLNVSGVSTFVGVSTFQANLFVDGTINSTTAVNVNGVSVIQSAVDEALALAIALG